MVCRRPKRRKRLLKRRNAAFWRFKHRKTPLDLAFWRWAGASPAGDPDARWEDAVKAAAELAADGCRRGLAQEAGAAQREARVTEDPIAGIRLGQ